MTAVHPESYSLVKQIAGSLNVTVEEVIRRPELLENVDRAQFTAGVYTLSDILEELRKPGRDPRDKFVAPTFNDAVRELADVQPGMVMEGVVTNVTRFGAFVDIGVHQDGLVHVSELSNRFIKDPADVAKVGQIVKVKVLNVDPKSRRIALSMKALLEPAGKPRPARQRQEPRQPTLDEKLASLANRWKSR